MWAPIGKPPKAIQMHLGNKKLIRLDENIVLFAAHDMRGIVGTERLSKSNCGNAIRQVISATARGAFEYSEIDIILKIFRLHRHLKSFSDRSTLHWSRLQCFVCPNGRLAVQPNNCVWLAVWLVRTMITATIMGWNDFAETYNDTLPTAAQRKDELFCNKRGGAKLGTHKNASSHRQTMWCKCELCLFWLGVCHLVPINVVSFWKEFWNCTRHTFSHKIPRTTSHIFLLSINLSVRTISPLAQATSFKRKLQVPRQS